MSNIKLVKSPFELEEEYVLELNEKEDITPQLLLELSKQHSIPKSGYLVTKSYDPRKGLFNLAIIENFVNRLGSPVTYNGRKIIGPLPVMKKLFLDLNRGLSRDDV